MLAGSFAAVLQAKDRDEFRDEVVRFAHELGFETVAALTVASRRSAVEVDDVGVGQPAGRYRSW